MEELKKDLSTKELLRNPDVFADISNVHLFGGEEVIRPEDLEPLPQDMVHRKDTAKLETLMRHVRLRLTKEGTVIAMIQAENQAGITLRALGKSGESIYGFFEKIATLFQKET